MTNKMDRVLAEDLRERLDRLATAIPEGAMEGAGRKIPRLRMCLDRIEARLAAQYEALTDAYGSWERTLEDLENVWALASWRSTVEEAPEGVSKIAA